MGKVEDQPVPAEFEAKAGEKVKVTRADFPLSDFPAGEVRPVRVGKRSVLVFRTGDSIMAVSNRCPHQETPFGTDSHRKSSERDLLVCPLHEWVFDLGTGQCQTRPDCPLRRYRADISDGTVTIDVGGFL